MDDIEFETTQKTVKFHHLRLKRKEDVIIQKKKKKIEWLRKMYYKEFFFLNIYIFTLNIYIMSFLY